jgi:DNA-binding NarL/FixJ family response regulator
MTQPTLIIADDHPLFRAALKEAVGRNIPGAQIVEASSLDTLQHAISRNPDADAILLDLRMPGAKGFSSLLYLRAEHPTVPVIIVSASEDASVVQRALDFGASGFIPKSARIESIGDSLRTVLGGGVSGALRARTPCRAQEQDRAGARAVDTASAARLQSCW